MPSSIYFPTSQRSNGLWDKGRLTNDLPSYSSSAVQEKLGHHRSAPWIVPLSLPIPGIRSRRLRIPLPNFRLMHDYTVSRFGRKRGSFVLFLTACTMLFAFFTVAKKLAHRGGSWSKSRAEPATLVFKREDLQRIWKWEVESGHFPSSQKSMHFLSSSNFPNTFFSSRKDWIHGTSMESSPTAPTSDSVQT